MRVARNAASSLVTKYSLERLGDKAEQLIWKYREMYLSAK
jgi:hypothetical protein